jgi:predicted esterase YcpF (UPF0227 family)
MKRRLDGFPLSSILAQNLPKQYSGAAMIVYIHGFRSAPSSEKARLLADRLAERGLADAFWCEQLPASPKASVLLIEEALARHPGAPTLVGSSLGGYYATYLAEKHDLRAVLINPAVVAHLSLAQYLGPQSNVYTGEIFEFTQEHIAELEALEVPRLAKPERFWLLAETGDQVLDYRQAVEKYAGACQTIVEGGDHSFTRFPEYLDAIIDYAGLR